MTDGREPVNGIKGWQSQTTPMGGIAMAETCKGGLTKRELFAAMAMQGLLSNSYESKTVAGDTSGKLKLAYAMSAVAMADALIAELNKEQTT